MRTPVQTQMGFYVQLRDPSRFRGGYWPHHELPEAVRVKGWGVCPRASFGAGRLTHGGPWRVGIVYVPHESVPFGEPEAVEFASRIAAAVEEGTTSRNWFVGR